MAITSQVSQFEFSGNESTTTPYALPNLRFDDSSWLVVEEITSSGITTLALGVDYTVTGNGVTGSGNIVTGGRSIPSESILRVTRRTPATQEAGLSASGAIPSTTLERMADKLTMLAQDLARQSEAGESRALRLPAGETAQEIPSNRGGMVLFFDANGGVSVITPSALLALSGGAPDGVGAPPGGESGATLTKLGPLDFDFGWVPATTPVSVRPKGVFADDVEALANGVSFGEVYRKANGETAWRQKIDVTSIALLGDSIIEAGSSGLTQLISLGYWVWARIFGGSKWDPVPNGSSLDFATSGARTDQLIATQLPALLLSGASVCLDGAGLNDVMQSISADTIVANRRSIWSQCVDEGIQPLALSITPIPLGYPGNSGGTFSNAVAAVNLALRSAAQADGVPFFDYAAIMEVTPGSGIANTAYTVAANDVHPNNLGASVLGRQLAAFMESNFDFSYDPAAETTWITPNVAFAGSSGQPTSWGPPGQPSGGDVISKTLEEGGDYDWWVLELKGVDASYQLYNFAANIGGSAVGKVVEGIVEFEVLSGEFWVGMVNNVADGTGTSYDNFSGVPFATSFKASDSVCVLRTPKSTVGSGATLVWPLINILTLTGGVIRFRRAGIRDVTP